MLFKSVLQIIKPPVQDPLSFLLQHILKDLEQLMNTLGKSMDETTNVVHLILCSLLKDHHQHVAQCKKSGLLVFPVRQFMHCLSGERGWQ